MERLYVYAIASAADAHAFRMTWRKHQAPVVYAVQEGDLVALVGRATVGWPERPSHRAVCQQLTLHEFVLDAAQQAFPVLPVKFATVFPSEEAVRRMLLLEHQAFSDALAVLGRRQQVRVTVTWDVEAVYTAGEARLPVPAAACELAQRTPEERMALGHQVAAYVECERASLMASLRAALGLTDAQVHESSTIDASKAGTLVLLIDETKRRQLSATLRRWAATMPWRVQVRCSQPGPATAFATVRCALPDPQAIAEARRVLGLQEDVPPRTIIDAYQTACVGADAEQRDVLCHAYRCLRTFAQHHRRVFPGAACSFHPRWVEHLYFASVPMLPDPVFPAVALPTQLA